MMRRCKRNLLIDSSEPRSLWEIAGCTRETRMQVSSNNRLGTAFRIYMGSNSTTARSVINAHAYIFSTCDPMSVSAFLLLP
jgi:hypothetical protein